MKKPVVVGVDGSQAGLAAAHYAASMAIRHQTELKLIYVHQSYFYGWGPVPLAPSFALADAEARQLAKESLAHAAAEIDASHPGVSVETQLLDGLPAPVLIDLSQEATATVVGSRGIGGFEELLLGSVSAQVASHGHGTVVVVRPAADPGGPVLVCYDGSKASVAALHFAAAEAMSRNVRLVVTNVYWPKPWGVGPKPQEDPAVTAEREAEELIKQGLAQLLEAHPQLTGEAKLIQSLNVEKSLVEESGKASLTVVGCRGRGGFAGLLLGSVSRTLVHHGAGPVAVIHPSEN
jgi:nucleotide-binding universal stress UspA family protein